MKTQKVIKWYKRVLVNSEKFNKREASLARQHNKITKDLTLIQNTHNNKMCASKIRNQSFKKYQYHET